MPQIILDQAEIIATVRQGIATAMPQHMGMYMKRNPAVGRCSVPNS